MKLTTVVELRAEFGASGKSAQSSRVRSDYPEEQLATRVKGQFRTAKRKLDADLEARRKARDAQMTLFPPGPELVRDTEPAMVF